MVFLTRLRQATAHPFLLEPVLKDTLRLEDLEHICAGLALFGGKMPAINQIRDWRANNVNQAANPVRQLDPISPVFGISKFGHEIEMERYIRVAMASKNDEVCNMCLQILSDPQIADVSPIL
jgi:hypothetical protein